MTILKPNPIALFILILSTTLVVTQSKNVQPNNSNSIIEETCYKTPNYGLCVNLLKPYPGSSEATVNGLAIIMFRIMRDKAHETQYIIRDLLAQRLVSQKPALIECNDLYGSIYNDGSVGMGDLLRDSNYKDAEFRANDAQNKANTCENRFYRALGTPLSDNNNFIKEVGKIAAAIVPLIQ
jgi:pectinesterase inhibitor-like protein